jgi:YD repeat-containing protein
MQTCKSLPRLDGSTIQDRISQVSAATQSVRTLRRRKVAAFPALLILIFTVRTLAQVAAPTIPDNGPTPISPLGILPHSSSSGTNESISMMNGSLNVYIPLLSIPQRGGYNLSLGLVHKSNQYTLVQNTAVGSTVNSGDGIDLAVDTIQYSDSMQTFDQPLNINLPRLQFSYEYVGDYDFTSSSTITGTTTISSVGNIYCATNFQFTDWSGNKHPFENVSTCNWHLGGPNSPPVNLTDSSDGSFFRLDTSTQTDLKVYSTDGTVYHFYGFSNLFPDNATAVDSFSSQEDYYDGRANLIVDPNGNQITIQATYPGNTYTLTPNYTLTDTLGRTIGITPADISYADSNGAPQTIGILTSPSTDVGNYTFALNCNYVGQRQNSPYVTPTVSTFNTLSNMPASSTSTITFPASAGGGQKEYTLQFNQIGQLTNIQYPFGGSTKYDYGPRGGTQLMGQVQCSVPMPEVAHKYECTSSSSSSCTEQTTTYTPTFVIGWTPYNATMTVTDPLGNQELHEFSTTNPSRTNPQETDVNSLSPSGTLLRAVHNTFPTIIPPGGNSMISFDYNFPTRTTTTLYDVTPVISSSIAYTYEAYAALPNYGNGIIDNPTEIDTTDYNGTVTQKVSQQWMPESAFTSSPLIPNRLQSRTTTDSAATVSSTITYCYDGSGNVISKTVSGTGVTSATSNCTGVTGLVTQYPRNAYGEITSVIDPKSYTTTIGYGDAWSSGGGTCGIASSSSAYPTSVTNAAGQKTKYSYNACSGTIATVQDPNSVTQTYSYDALGRVLCDTATGANSALAGMGCNTFLDSTPTSVSLSVAQSSSQRVTTKTTYDGFGRLQETALTSDPEGTDFTDTTYDPLGRVQSVSNPYRSTSDPTFGITSYAYDALGRKVNECHPDNSSTSSTTCTPQNDYESWSYGNNVVTFVDEVGNQWQRTSDALGRLTKVLEPSGLSRTPTMETDYTYDALKDLLSVSQCGGTCPSSASRVRSFSYNGLAQLITASNPETGTVCYGVGSGSNCVNGYDQDGNLQYKTDARGITTSYSYDILNRLLSKSYSDNTTPYSCFQYDASTTANSIGRLTTEWTLPRSQSGGCSGTSGFITMRTIVAYDAMGRVLSEQQCTPNLSGPGSCTTSSSNPFALSYLYDLAGNTTAYANGVSNVPGVGTIAFGLQYDAAGRLEDFSSSWNPSSSSSGNPLSLFTADPTNGYTAAGAIQNMVLGNSIFINKTYDIRLRTTGETAKHP